MFFHTAVSVVEITNYPYVYMLSGWLNLFVEMLDSSVISNHGVK